MSALALDVMHAGWWREANRFAYPTPRGGSLSNTTEEDGVETRELIHFHIYPDHAIVVSARGEDVDLLGDLRATLVKDLEPVARLNKENPTYELNLKTDRMQFPVQARFRYVA